MKRFIDIVTWIILAALVLVLVNMLRDDEPAPQNNEQQLIQRVEPIMQKKQELTDELVQCRAEFADIQKDSGTLMLLFTTLDEEILTKAGPSLDEKGYTALICLDAELLTQLASNGIPAHLQARLDAGWEIVLSPASADGLELMYSQLSSLGLKASQAIYLAGDSAQTFSAEQLESHDIGIILYSDPDSKPFVEDMWAIFTQGNMNPTVLTSYNNARDNGGAITYSFSSGTSDSRYIHDNLLGLLQLLEKEANPLLVQTPEEALVMHRKWELEHGQHAADIENRIAEIEAELNGIQQQLMRLGVATPAPAE